MADSAASKQAVLPAELERIIFGFMASHALFTGDELGVLDRLAAGGTHPAEELARARGVSAAALDRLLVALVSLGVLERAQGGYRMAEHLRPFLDRKSERYCGGMFPLLKNFSTQTFMHLTSAIGDGKPKWDRVLPRGTSPFEAFFSQEETRERFGAAMWAMGYLAAKELVPLLALEGRHQLVDLGGGSGSFSVAALERWPELTARIYDLPAMEPTVRGTIDRHGLSGRLEFMGGDFFNGQLPEADVYSLGYILSDWTDEVCVQLLRRVHAVMPPGGRVLILERLFDDDKAGPVPTALMDLCMMLESGGRHRTVGEYNELLRSSGFQPQAVYRSSGEKHMVIGSKPDGTGQPG